MVGFTLDIYEPPADTIIIGEGGVMDYVLNINRLELLQKIKGEHLWLTLYLISMLGMSLF